MPAVSKEQQKIMGMARAVQKGEMRAPSKAVADIAKSMKPGDVKDFAETKRKGLPEKKKTKAAEFFEKLSKGLPCPGSKIRSKGMGRGLGIGRGKGPISPVMREAAKKKKEEGEEEKENGKKKKTASYYSALEGTPAFKVGGKSTDLSPYKRKKREAFKEGFQKYCEQRGIDPDAFMKAAQGWLPSIAGAATKAQGLGRQLGVGGPLLAQRAALGRRGRRPNRYVGKGGILDPYAGATNYWKRKGLLGGISGLFGF